MKCFYCSDEIKKGAGIMYVYNNGTVRHFCSGRCYKNSVVLGRKYNRKESRK